MAPSLLDIRDALQRRLGGAARLPCHVRAFVGWITGDRALLESAIEEAKNFHGQARHPEHVSALGYAVAADTLSQSDRALLADYLTHLAGRAFFVAGRPLRFEIDGIALLGTALGAAAIQEKPERKWLSALLQSSTEHVGNHLWHLGLARAAQEVLDGTELRIVPPDLASAVAAKGIGDLRDGDRQAAWALSVQLDSHDDGTGRDAVRLAIVQNELASLGQVNLVDTKRSDLVRLLQNVSRGMKRWTFEKTNRTPRSRIAQWFVENEYHVQNLLWVVLAPVFPDLEDEENLPSLGHKKPRADLGVPSLRTIVEVKFLRGAGQAACADLIEEIAADASLYRSQKSGYDDIVVFVWDDAAQTEQHHELRMGIESIGGVSAAIILPRPSVMPRSGQKTEEAPASAEDGNV
jgi:hypothetical protein